MVPCVPQLFQIAFVLLLLYAAAWGMGAAWGRAFQIYFILKIKNIINVARMASRSGPGVAWDHASPNWDEGGMARSPDKM